MNRTPNKNVLLTAFVVGTLLVLILIQITFNVTVAYKGMVFPFGDLTGISSASECIQAGLNPYLENPIDPLGREFNYPPIWLYVSDFLHFDGKDVVPVGLTLIFLFTLTTCFLFKAKNVKQCLIFLTFFFSPPVLLLLERGNSDGVLFMLVAFMTVYLPKIRRLNPQARLYTSAVIILISSLLKLYPLVLLPLLIIEPVSLRKRITVMICTGLLILGYLICSLDIITLITHNTPQPLIMAYGKNVLLEKFFPDELISVVSNGLIVLVIIAVILLNSKGKGFISKLYPSDTTTNETILPFIAGVLIFAGTFVIGNNYIYRLVFLLLTLPYLLDQLTLLEASREESPIPKRNPVFYSLTPPRAAGNALAKFRHHAVSVSSENSLLAACLLLMVVYGTGALDFLSSDIWRVIDWCMVGILPILLLLSLIPCFRKNNEKRSVEWMSLLTILQCWMLLLTFYGYRMGEFFIFWYAIMGLACWGLLLSFLVASVHYLIHHFTPTPARPL